MAKGYSMYIDKVMKGRALGGNLVRGGFTGGVYQMSPYGAPVSDETQAKATRRRRSSWTAPWSVYQVREGHTGKELIAAGAKQEQTESPSRA